MQRVSFCRSLSNWVE